MGGDGVSAVEAHKINKELNHIFWQCHKNLSIFAVKNKAFHGQ